MFSAQFYLEAAFTFSVYRKESFGIQDMPSFMFAAAAAAAVIGFVINRKITGKGGTVIHIMSHDC